MLPGENSPYESYTNLSVNQIITAAQCGSTSMSAPGVIPLEELRCKAALELDTLLVIHEQKYPDLSYISI